ncbi:molybdate ABC transporter substrate-binding protein [Marinobacter orientalis]|uniref:Molybdate ABC transporter substrate-binding protein n=1 Tax=Marinobacter orientalis TaxID=1928859 RepID=A0A7Y0NJ66_9GAMM|nr:molybdate ABC transporter substrate-binding protein [Marinobacter orientalis]NMT62435.1 molybdate ABC transporter substrate-binding protein [Marinobacter orientalis]TGX51135.1 molybdate ABC transporter substrate-binding protein [Marinobacter orientalis]
MKLLRPLLLTWSLLFAMAAHADKFTIAAASDLRFALDDILEVYRHDHPEHEIAVVYGSSGKMTTQIMNGAPYDLFFSADISFPQRLKAEGFTATDPAIYAIGRIVIWSNTLDASELTLGELPTEPHIRRIAIAQPSHAPYGLRAQEALRATGAWEAVQPKLVFGENIAHTAQMVESGAADVGIIALSLAKFPDMARHPHHLIDEKLHNPLTQGYIVTKRGDNKPPVADFAHYMETDAAHQIMERYGFVMPE